MFHSPKTWHRHELGRFPTRSRTGCRPHWWAWSWVTIAIAFKGQNYKGLRKKEQFYGSPSLIFTKLGFSGRNLWTWEKNDKLPQICFPIVSTGSRNVAILLVTCPVPEGCGLNVRSKCEELRSFKINDPWFAPSQDGFPRFSRGRQPCFSWLTQRRTSQVSLKCQLLKA